MAEKPERIEFEYTHTYDQFTVFFYGDQVFVGKKNYSIGTVLRRHFESGRGTF